MVAGMGALNAIASPTSNSDVSAVEEQTEGRTCEIVCSWFFGYCTAKGYRYRCNALGRVCWDHYNEGCSNHCGCRCDSE